MCEASLSTPGSRQKDHQKQKKKKQQKKKTKQKRKKKEKEKRSLHDKCPRACEKQL